jgi:PP-loop superfamily ATP-utilizing enzyme
MNDIIDPHLADKFEHLKRILAGLESAVVAFSGGVDSTFLLAVAVKVLGARVLAVTATSETYPERELVEARSLAGQLGARHSEVVSEELDIRKDCRTCWMERISMTAAIIVPDVRLPKKSGCLARWRQRD